ncbi:MAG: hypothetical protein AAF481_00760 [Acidobacteriota bacterium]
MAKGILGLLLALSLLGNAYLFVLSLDAGMILDNAQTEAERLWERRERALTIINRAWVGTPIEELSALTDELEAKGWLIDRHDGEWELHDFVFRIEDSRVVEVRDYDSLRR